MHEFKHPNYYKELRKRNREVLRSGRGLAVNQAPHVSDQAISLKAHDGERERAPDPGLKLPDSTMVKQRASSSTSRGQEQQASSVKPQAPEETSDKRQAPSSKPQA